MSTITREQLHERAREKVKSLEFAVTQTAFADSRAELEEELELARIALASLEADPVAWLLSGGGAKNNVSFDSGNAYADPLREVTPLYTAPPATVSVPDGVLKNLLPDAEKPEFWFEHNGTIFFEGVKFNNAVFDACRAAMLQSNAEPVSNRDELRVKVRGEHAEWSQATFGDVGPVGPLKHLSKEALEAAAEPGDLSEWADMQFLLWDAQRRAGITDEQITQAMIEKLEVNKARRWPEPKEGEPRQHIKPAPEQEEKQCT